MSNLTEYQYPSEIVVILDRSGSMAKVADTVIKSFNDFLAAQQRYPDKCRLTLVQFNHKIDALTHGRPLSEVIPLNKSSYVPKGGTRLHDAVGQTIDDVSDRIDESLPTPYRTRVLCAILTDGEDTDSADYTVEDIARLITKKRTRSQWEFVFLGANQVAKKAGQQLGIPAAACVDIRISSAGVQAAGALLNQMASTFRQSGTIDNLQLQQSYDHQLPGR